MTHELWWDDENYCVRFEAVGEHLPEEVAPLVAQVLELLEGREPRCLLVDHARLTTTTSRETRAALEQQVVPLALTRHAFCGISPLNRMIARVIIGMAGRSEHTKFFKSRDEALAWLRGER